MRELTRLVKLFKPYRRHIGVGLICLLLATPATLFHPLVWKYIVDEVVVGRNVDMLLPALGLMIIVHLSGVGLNMVRTYLLGTVGQKFIFDLRRSLYSKMQEHSLSYYHNRRAGDLIARCVGDVETLQEAVTDGVDSIIANALQFVIVAGILIWLNWKVGILILLPMAFVVVLIRMFNARIRGLYRRIRDRLGDVSAKLQENFTGILIIKAFAREPHELRKFEEHAAAYRDESIKGIIARTFYFPSVSSVGFMSNVIMVGVGAWFVLQGEFTIGGLVAYRGYWWQLFSPVNTLARTNEMIQRMIAASSRVFEVLDEPVEIADRPSAIELPTITGRIVCRNITFAYNGLEENRTDVLRDVSFEVESGGKVGLVGPSGAGKSTVIGLLLRLYEPQHGQILVDDIDITDTTQRSLRSHMAAVTQEPFLFNDTIRNNILFGRLGAESDAVYDAARQANAHTFIEALPNGYETIVGERGVKLSGGQKQRVSIARAFLANPRILLLDEATASVEPESEALIQKALERLEEGRTAVIVSHRLSMVRDCEQILVVLEGEIAERGTHDNLMQSGGWYSRMYNLQMGSEASLRSGSFGRS
jgi:ATP-binding cassette, subfamily B, bacterial